MLNSLFSPYDTFPKLGFNLLQNGYFYMKYSAQKYYYDNCNL